MTLLRWAALLAGLVFVPLAATLVGLAFVVGPSWSGWAYALGVALLASGLVATARTGDGRLSGAALALLLGAACVHGLLATRGAHVSMTTTATGAPRWVGRIVDEGDGATLGAYLMVQTGLIRDPDVPAVPRAMHEAYAEMRAAEGDVPSPVVSTYLGLESPSDADDIVVEPPRRPRGALIFLHGWGGNYTLPCWQVARAAAEVDLVTYCPSVGWRGEWASADGERTLRAALALPQARGIDRIFLAGLSNGAIGASLLANRFRGQFCGVILISGASARAGAPGVPVLVVQGDDDALCPASIARDYARRVGATYARLHGGHFALLLERTTAHRAIAAWLARTGRDTVD